LSVNLSLEWLKLLLELLQLLGRTLLLLLLLHFGCGALLGLLLGAWLCFDVEHVPDSHGTSR
jgi:hypothetical protein